MIINCKKKKLKKAAKFYAEKLGIPDDTIILIQSKKNLEVAGYCEPVALLPNAYLIVLDTSKSQRKLEDPVSVLAHEMVHVKQYALGELQDKASKVHWNGVPHEGGEVETEAYYFSPWEIEAFGMQVGLYSLYLKELDK